MQIIYREPFICDVKHDNGSTLRTSVARPDMPHEAFSPTDLLGVSLGTCILSTMAIVARRKYGLDMVGARVDVTMHRQEDHKYRIGRIDLHILMPITVTDEQREGLESAAAACPVHHALNPKIKVHRVFQWQGS